jgi:hypothetical protein
MVLGMMMMMMMMMEATNAVKKRYGLKNLSS